MIDTKDKILDAAERLFGEEGYAATSLRQIIAQAGVNLAAIHYHFGTKEELLDQLISRRADPVNRMRLDRLERAEAEAAGTPVAIEKILDAFLRPAAEMSVKYPGMPRVMGRLYAEGSLPEIIQRHFLPTGQRFAAALRRTLPDLPEDEFGWRMHFTLGAMAHALLGRRVFESAADEGLEKRLTCLVAFVAAGFRAPAASRVSEIEVTR